MTISPQQIINDRYKIVTILNHGSFGVVSLAKDTWNQNTLVALKCIHKVKDAVIDEAQEEINVHKILGKHKYIAPVLDHFEFDDSTFLVMEYYPNGDLYEAIRSDCGPANVLEFMLQLIEAVEYAHSKGVYHRDIKPENILIASDGSVRLADWGLSTIYRQNTEFGVGSERYMAPELFDLSIDCYDAEKADIWSIGICLLNVLFARNPFTIACQKDKLFLDFCASRESLFDIFPTLTQDTFAALRYALTIDPDNRSLEGMRIELDNVITWTTDDEYYDEYEEEDYSRDVSRSVSIAESAATSVSSSALLDTIVPTTVQREPLRTPSILSPQTETFNIAWDRTMQFTPPNPSYFDKTAAGFRSAGTSRLAQVLAQNPSLRMESVSEEEDQMFAMDSLSGALPEETGRSDVSSICSVPSLIRGGKGFNSLASSMSFASGTSSQSQGGKSWSDLIFDDEEDGEFDEGELMKAVSSMPRFGASGVVRPVVKTKPIKCTIAPSEEEWQFVAPTHWLLSIDGWQEFMIFNDLLRYEQALEGRPWPEMKKAQNPQKTCT